MVAMDLEPNWKDWRKTNWRLRAGVRDWIESYSIWNLFTAKAIPASPGNGNQSMTLLLVVRDGVYVFVV